MSQTSNCTWPHMPPDCGCPVGGYVGGQPTSAPPLLGGSRDGGRGATPMAAGYNPAMASLSASTGNPALAFLL